MKLNLKIICLPLASALLLAGISLNAQNKIANPAAPQNAVPDAAMTTILPPQEAEKLFKWYFNGDDVFGKQDRHHRIKETYWTPTAEDVAGAEAALAAYPKIAASPKDYSRPQVFLLADYFRQYAGVMRGESRRILIDCFPATDGTKPLASPDRGRTRMDDWSRSHAALVADGGFGFFHAVYNPATRKIEHLEFNGFA